MTRIPSQYRPNTTPCWLAPAWGPRHGGPKKTGNKGIRGRFGAPAVAQAAVGYLGQGQAHGVFQ